MLPLFKLPRFITFDCYGTLVDFTLKSVTLRVLGDRLDGVNADAFLADYSAFRYQEVLGEYKPYSQVLRDSLRKAMEYYGLEYRDSDGDATVAAVPGFGPFPDTPPALEKVRRACKIVIITNSEDAMMAQNVERIGVPFDRVITAEQARAYKPSLTAFHYAQEQLGAAPDEILHVAQGFEYDIMPAQRMGWARVWINRNNRAGNAAYGPYTVLPNLTGLPELLGLA